MDLSQLLLEQQSCSLFCLRYSYPKISNVRLLIPKLVLLDLVAIKNKKKSLNQCRCLSNRSEGVLAKNGED